MMGLLLSLPTWSLAQMTIGELSQTIKAPNAVAQMGPGLFGDEVNLYTGGLQFVQTDVSLKGNSALPVRVARRLSTGVQFANGRAFGSWELDIPYMHGVFSSSLGWTVDNFTNARCSAFSAPPDASGNQGGVFSSAEYWQGNYLYVPEVGEQQMLARDPANTAVPSPASSYPVVTPKFWAMSCLPSLANDASPTKTLGEGFLAISPDGTQYRFDQMVSYATSTITKPIGSGGALLAKGVAGVRVISPMAAINYFLSRKEVRLLPTLITDRFGNWVRYNYDATNQANVNSITSSDGRTITLTYGLAGDPRAVTSVSDGTRTWTYGYHLDTPTSAALDTVSLPDASQWQLTSAANLMREPAFSGSSGCGYAFGTGGTLSASMVHPSGATGSFTLTLSTHGRSRVEKSCSPDNSRDLRPLYFYTYSLTNKTLSGAGLSSLAWNYVYGPANASYSTCTTCATSKTVTVTNPSGQVNRYVYGNQYRLSEGRMEQLDEGWNGSAALRSTTYHYRAPGAGPYPALQGLGGESYSDGESLAQLMPMDQRSITQQGSSFTWGATVFDTFARPTTVSRSGPGASRAETTTYEDNLSKWVLGQIKVVTETGTGAQMVANIYDPTSANLLTASRFGKLEQTYTYWSDGTLNTRKDGLNQTTTLSNYKRGQAQNVSYADGKTESAVVNNLGQLSSATDANGFTTSYGYDALGRLSQITPPADSPSWNATTAVFESVSAAEYGLAAGHWRQTIATGNARTITYFDALWRPALTRTFDAADEANTRSMVLRKFDADGRSTFVSYPARSIVAVTDTPGGLSTQYDALGRAASVQASSELGVLSTVNYFDPGFQARQINPRGHTTTTGYTAWDRPEQASISSIAAPEGVSVSISRDVFGKPLSITRAGAGASVTRSYVYDANQLLCKTIEPETGATIQVLDAANNVTWRASGQTFTSTGICNTANVSAPAKTSFSYDTRNRLLSTSFGDASPAITRTYTNDGLLASINSNAANWSYSYNKLRLLATENLSYNSVAYNTTRSYDANGSLSQLSYPPNGAYTVAYNPNALGQASQAGAYANTVRYHPNGAVASYTLGNGKTHSLTQNTRGLPAVSTDTGVVQDSHTYDANANVASITDGINGKNRSMGYDGLDRLISANAPSVWGTGSFSYDALDNLSASTLGARNSSHTYDANNRLSTINTNGVYTGYSYDPQGNTTAKGAQGYYFDLGKRLILVSGVASYSYDGLGRRVYAVSSPQATYRTSVYSQGGQLLYTNLQQGTNNTSTRYIYLGAKLIAEDGSAGVSYAHTDALGSPVARTSSTGALLNNTWYEPYGKTAAGTNPTTLGFTGHVNDIDTGLIYMQQRYYEPVSGRFLSVDAVNTNPDTGGSFNRYAYANNNPYKNVDPDGRNPWAARIVYTASYEAATWAGAGILGGLIGAGIYDLIHMNESAEPPKSEPKKDGQGASNEEKKNSVGGDTEGKRVPSSLRDEILEDSRNSDGTWTCWRCGGSLADSGKVDIGHKNVPRSKGGNLHPDNLACEGQACNRSAGNRGEVKPGSDCVGKGCAKSPEPQAKPPEKLAGG
jgi:RHS repeat-associated protein